MKDDVISRQAAIEALYNEIIKRRFLDDVNDGMLDEFDTEDILRKLSPVEPKYGKWIPVSEQLPNEDENVLVSVHFLGLKQVYPNGFADKIPESFYVDIASQVDGEWSSISDEYKICASKHKIIAWMPLPKPYQEGDK